MEEATFIYIIYKAARGKRKEQGGRGAGRERGSEMRKEKQKRGEGWLAKGEREGKAQDKKGVTEEERKNMWDGSEWRGGNER